MPKIVLLNGISSAGKSTLAKALQDIAGEPFLHVEMDVFLGMMPRRYANHSDAFAFLPQASAIPEVAVVTGPYGASLMRGMRRSIVALAAEGLSIIVDDVVLDGDISDYRELSFGFDLIVIGVKCDLQIAEDRERQRGDRDIGLARWQHPRVHEGIDYDLVVDTSLSSPLQCAEAIRAAFDL